MNKKNIIIILICNLIFSISYYQEIQPIFNTHCIECHSGGNFASGGLELTNYENVMAGGDSGVVIIPGDYANSILWQQINSGEMPDDSDPLAQEQISIIEEWINEEARVCDEGFAYHPEVADNLHSDYINITIQDQEYNPCFYESDLEALADIITINDFQNITDPFKLGIQTWNSGRVRFLVAGYYFSGVEEIIHTIPESIDPEEHSLYKMTWADFLAIQQDSYKSIEEELQEPSLSHVIERASS